MSSAQGGVAQGWGWADPAVGLAITVAILLVLRAAAREVYRRLMDAVDPALVDAAEHALQAVPGVAAVGDVRLRWIGHQLRAETDVVVAPTSPSSTLMGSPSPRSTPSATPHPGSSLPPFTPITGPARSDPTRTSAVEAAHADRPG